VQVYSKFRGCKGGVVVRFGRRYALFKQVTREGPLEVWVKIGTYYYFLTQTLAFFM